MGQQGEWVRFFDKGQGAYMNGRIIGRHDADTSMYMVDMGALGTVEVDSHQISSECFRQGDVIQVAGLGEANVFAFDANEGMAKVYVKKLGKFVDIHQTQIASISK